MASSLEPATAPRILDRSAFCAVAPHPRLKEQLAAGFAAGDQGAGLQPEPQLPGFNDAVVRPGGAPGFAAEGVQRAQLRGTVRVAVVLVEFSDHKFGVDTAHFNDLFFSTGVVPTGSVKEFYGEVTNGLVDIQGAVVGPLTMPHKLSWYANGNFGIGKPTGDPRAQILAQDAAKAADAVLDFTPYDNDGDGYVDAFVVVHAGSGGEETGNSGDIWSHKYVLPKEYQADNVKIFAYLTIPEDAKLGVSAHELGHLLFGFPDLYDTDYSSEGVGDWCLMGAGSWNNGGDTPAHPSAWCKAQQGWADVVNVDADRRLDVQAVEDSKTMYRAWTQGQQGQEYFLIENRQLTGFDAALPAPGLLLWHVDDSKTDNTDENHYWVGLVQADGSKDLEHGTNRGDAGDCYPGSSTVRTVDATTNPSTQTYAGQDSQVRLRNISDSGSAMSVDVSVTGADGGGTPGGGGDGDLAAQVAALTQRVSALESALASVAQALMSLGTSGAKADTGNGSGNGSGTKATVVDVSEIIEAADIP